MTHVAAIIFIVSCLALGTSSLWLPTGDAALDTNSHPETPFRHFVVTDRSELTHTYVITVVDAHNTIWEGLVQGGKVRWTRIEDFQTE